MAKTDWKMGDTVGPTDMNQLGQEINNLASSGLLVVKTGVNMNNELTPGWYYVTEGATNSPQPSGYYRVVRRDDYYILQIFYSDQGKGTWTRARRGNVVWPEWSRSGGGGLITPNVRLADININNPVANTYYTLIDISSAGRLSRLVVTGTQTNNNYRVRLRVDGVESSLATESGQAHNGRGYPHASGTTAYSAAYSLDYFTDIEFKSLKIEIMSTVAATQMQGSADYALV
ncbi:hypothetical protein D3P09_02215 [Paenibacillus pinisoli]|uniref:Uncharacterized protein n=1 Tax=Paenibacillus pinisoli TaxID=1276110 RepID=A0A3A6PRH6_9BACL|nr:pyocin knob domain-containing protein [Paenibacillus pinisoli]RJX40859.1 hypothetical protein D3P09_02215 [Paenibacillus pinisoli]